MGKVKAKNGKDVTKTGDQTDSNGRPPQQKGTIAKAGGGGASGARGSSQGAGRSTKNDRTRGDPVSVISGQVVRDSVDLALPGPIPVVLRRQYTSAFNTEVTPFGRGGWSHALHQFIATSNGELVLRGDDGRNLTLPPVSHNSVVLMRGDRLEVRRNDQDVFQVENLETFVTRTFAPLSPGGVPMLRELRDRWGNRVELVYKDTLLVAVRAFGRELRLTYDAKGRIVRAEAWAAGAAQQAVAYAYSAEGELVRATDALGSFELYAYDGLNRLKKTTLKNGVSFGYEYDDDLGRCVRTVGDGGLHSIEFIYDLAARTTVSTGWEARKFSWNEKGALLKEQTPDGYYAIEYEYDPDLLVTAEKNAAGQAYRYEYDGRGNRTGVTDPAGNVTRIEYKDDLPTRRVSPDGHVTEYVFDRRGALTELRTATGLHYQLTYDGFGQLGGIFGSEGAIAGFEYDEQHNLVREVNARGAATTYAYDAMGRPIARTDALGRTTRIEYDVMGRPVRFHQPDGTRIELAYDALGNVARHVDPMGHVTTMEYAGTGVLTKQTMPDGQVWAFQYDDGERLRRVVNPMGNEYSFFYDRAGRVEREEPFDGRVLKYAYTTSNRLLRIEKPDDTWREFDYDPLGNVVAERSPHGLRKYERDPLGRLKTASVIETSGKTVVAFERDAFGRVLAEVQNGQAVRYAYDAHGRRTMRQLPGGETTKYAYDRAGAFVQLDHDGHLVAVQRDALGREVRRHAARGRFDIFSNYDAMDRLIDRWVTGSAQPGAAAQVLSQRRWAYDANGRAIEIQDVRWGATRYAYDDIGQLLEAHRGTLHEFFHYDGAGSISSMLKERDGRSGGWTWSTDRGNVLKQCPDAEFEYDANRRRKKEFHRDPATWEDTGQVTKYFWDVRDQLREVRLPSGEKVLYTYDAFGRRVRKEIVPPAPAPGDVPTRAADHVHVVQFLWDGNVLAQELDTERGKRVFVHEPGSFVPMLQQEQGEVFTYVNDHLGTPKELIDQGGQVAWSAAHSAWGIASVTWTDTATRRGRTVETPFRLLGQYHDDETGLCYTRFRYFDPARARWLSPDPIGIEGGANLFALDGAPTNTVDPFGLCKAARARLAGTVSKVGVRYNENGGPVFDPVYSVQLPGRLIGPSISDDVQMRYATHDLRDELEENPALARAFTPEQMDDIEEGKPVISGLTWHHHEDGVTLQLVDHDLHAGTPHFGGRHATGGRP